MSESGIVPRHLDSQPAASTAKPEPGKKPRCFASPSPPLSLSTQVPFPRIVPKNAVSLGSWRDREMHAASSAMFTVLWGACLGHLPLFLSESIPRQPTGTSERAAGSRSPISCCQSLPQVTGAPLPKAIRARDKAFPRQEKEAAGLLLHTSPRHTQAQGRSTHVFIGSCSFVVWSPVLQGEVRKHQVRGNVGR